MIKLQHLAISLAFVLEVQSQTLSCPAGKTTIFFANGIDTDTLHAVGSALDLKATVLQRLAQLGGSAISADCLTFKLAEDFEFVESNNTIVNWLNVAAQLGVAANQVGIALLTPDLLWSWLAGTGATSTPSWFSNVVETYLTAQFSTSSSNLQSQLQLYQQELDAGHSVLVVAHSQGNLYANEAYTLLPQGEQRKFSVVAVASPAPSVKGGGPWYTLCDDIITLVPGALPANRSNDPPSACLTGDAIGCHDFNFSYLTGDNTGPEISDAVITSILLRTSGQLTCCILYDNTGPSSYSGASYAVGIVQSDIDGYGYTSYNDTVTSSFTISHSSTITGVNYLAWSYAGIPSTQGWQITTGPFGGAVLESGTATTLLASSVGEAYCPDSCLNGYWVSFAIPSIHLSPGTYWLQLSSGQSTGGFGPYCCSGTLFWDISGGPSSAYSNYGTYNRSIVTSQVGSETFQIIGYSNQ